MHRIKVLGNLKLIVLIGYVVLFALAIFGLVRIYKELVVFSEFNHATVQRKELSAISNALVSMYEAESVREIMLSENFYIPTLKSSYDDIDFRVRRYIDTLYTISPDKSLHAKLDTVNMLLDEKKRNFLSMMLLTDSIKNLPYSDVLSTKVLSRKDVTDLGRLVSSRMVEKKDTTYYVKEKRGFMARLRAVFVSDGDSTKVLNTEGVSVKDTLAYTPAEMLTDTLVHYINTVNAKSDKRKAAYVVKLSARQSAMFYFDEKLTGQINNILRQIEEDEQRIADRLLREKEGVLKRSSHIVSNIGVASLFVFILFLTLTVLLVNKNQRFRNDLEKSNQVARRLLKSREKLLLMISHDIKAPLSSIIGYIELMSRDSMTPEDRERLNTMRASSEQILDLSNKLMDFHRLEQGKSELNIVSFAPHTLLDDVCRSFIPATDKKRLFLKSELNISPDLTYRSDPFILRQVLNNLINNAIKFTSAGGITVGASVDPAHNLWVTVKDTGIGISSEDSKRIFDEFERAGHVDAKRSVEGFGLGLPIAKRLVELLGGKIDFTSVVGQGTEFRISIPMQKAEEPSDEPSMALPPNDARHPAAKKILWVDDDVALLNVYSKLLERDGAEVTRCEDAQKSIDILRNEHFDLIFTDIQMPVMNGFELIKKIRALGGYCASVPVVALSARSDVSEKDFKAAGFSCFLSKPISLELLRRIVGSHDLPAETPANNDTSHTGFDALIEYVKEDKTVSLDILDTFYADSVNKTKALKEALETEDWNTIQAVAHKMLPLMTMIGERNMADLLTRLEHGEKDAPTAHTVIAHAERVNKSAAEYIERVRLGH